MIHDPIVPIDGYSLREIIALPNIDEFQSMLQYRLNMSARDYVFTHKFTIFINSLSRRTPSMVNRYEAVDLIYAGIPTQRKLIENNKPKYRNNPSLDAAWEFLHESELDSSKAIVGSKLYQAFSRGSYTMNDLLESGMGTLKEYFKAILDPDSASAPPTSRQLAEYTILKHHFDIEKDIYFSVPLVLLGEIDGVMHYVCKAKDRKRLTRNALASLIRSASAMYETQFLEWDLVAANPDKAQAISAPLKPGFYKNVNRNPILFELGFERYYRDYYSYYESRVRMNDNIIHSKVYRPYLKAAITAIMIDSFAHNVSAHSLVALNWWFKKRAENLRTFKKLHQEEVAEAKDIINDYIEEGFDQDRIYDLLKPWMNGLFVRNADPDYDLVNFPGPLAREVQPLLKFLMQKGAFWSGISRDNNFGGEAISAFDTLWSDFINNPLYLGTIAKSEDIHRLRIRIIHYEPQATTTIEDHRSWDKPKKALLDGVFVEIDLKNRRPDIVSYPNGKRGYPFSEDACLCLETHPEMDELSDFVSPGEDYEAIKKVLQEIRLFFPGEVVGRHAFFTLLENKIRNVKHFKGDSLKRMQTEGLELCISFQESSIHPEETAPSLYNVGIWLNSPTPLILSTGKVLMGKRFDSLTKDIMDEETFAPRLGGTSQDKLCAGMLFNNFFYKVQNGDDNVIRDRTEDSSRDRTFYPWIVPATSPVDEMHNDFEFRPYTKAEWPELEKAYTHKFGYLKKYFRIWKAADIQWVTKFEDVHMSWENLARFRFVALNAEKAALRSRLYDRIRSEGVLRIIKSELTPSLQGEAAVLEAYHQWFKDWIGQSSRSIRLIVDQAVVGQFEYRPEQAEGFRYYPAWELDQITEQDSDHIQELYIAHGGEANEQGQLSYRNHGVYINYFQSEILPDQPLSAKAKARMAELFEILCTRITIIDNRVHYRLGSDDYRATLAKQLLIDVYDESSRNNDITDDWAEHWDGLKQKAISNANFLVIHLSFIEKILVTKYADHPDFGDENIGLFIQEEILPYATDPATGEVRDNFILVITTGRGRTKWWARLSERDEYKAYRKFTNFRPVESIISSLEDAINRKDDIEVKYNLTKVMFGS